MIYIKKFIRKACNSFWAIRISFCILSFISLITISLTLGATFDYVLFKKVDSFYWKLVGMLLLISIFIACPFWYGVYNNIKKKRKGHYELFLINLKVNRNLDSVKVDLLLEDIDNLRVKYRNERDYLINLFVKICKLLIFPITAIIFKTVTSNISVTLLMAIFVFSILISVFLAFWSDFDSFESLKSLGIRNDYMLTIAKKELIYIKENYLNNQT